MDPRLNGTIYATAPVRKELEKFERLLIRPDDFPNRARLAYLWSKGDQHSGRGMGKTALLRFFRQRINKDWGATEYHQQFSAVVVYVSFSSQIDRRYMEQLALSALIDICRNGVLDAARAMLRLDALTPSQQQAVLIGPDGRQNPANLLDDALLAGKGIKPEKLNEDVWVRLQRERVSMGVALALAQGQFEGYLRSLRKDGSLEPLYVPRDTKILDYSRGLLFNDIVYYLRTAGFAGGYLFVDDLENLVDQMTRRHRIEFAKELGLCLVRPGFANTAYNFFSCVLTTHQQASVGLATAWADAGLASIARLDPTSPNSVELPLPDKDEAKEIIVAHLDHYRSDPADTGSIRPFTDAGLEALISSQQMRHPRILLSTAARVVSYAVDQNATEIDPALVRAAMDTTPPPAARDFTDGIDSAL
jgi:hypothetical protein